MAAWDNKPNPLIKKRLYNLMADNDRILKRILNLSQKQLNQLLKLYAKNPEKLYKALQYWISKGTILNGANTSDLVTYINNMGTAYSIGAGITGTPIVTQQAIKAIMQDSIMNYVTNVDTTIKQKLAKILTDGYDNKQMPRDTVKKMQKHLEYNKYRASMLTHTETMRASNGASWSQAKVEGATHFIVDVRPGACKWCVKTFTGRVFKIDEVKYIPPLHPWCSCVPQFFFSEEEAQNAADEFKQRNLDEIKRLKDKGFEFPENGTGPLSPEAIAQRGIKPKTIKKNVPQTIKTNNMPQNQSKPVVKEPTRKQVTTTKPLDESTRKAISNYQINGYRPLNKALRRGTNLNTPDRKMEKSIDSSLQKAMNASASEGIVYRSMGNTVGKTITQVGKNGTFKDLGYCSTSKSKNIFKDERFKGGWHTTIQMPKGTRNIDVNKTLGSKTEFGKEKELILDKNTQFKVLEYDTTNKTAVLKVVNNG